MITPETILVERGADAIIADRLAKKIAKANPVDKFVLWGRHIAQSAILDAVILKLDSRARETQMDWADWVNQASKPDRSGVCQLDRLAIQAANLAYARIIGNLPPLRKS